MIPGSGPGTTDGNAAARAARTSERVIALTAITVPVAMLPTFAELGTAELSEVAVDEHGQQRLGYERRPS